MWASPTPSPGMDSRLLGNDGIGWVGMRGVSGGLALEIHAIGASSTSRGIGMGRGSRGLAVGLLTGVGGGVYISVVHSNRRYT